MTTIILLLLGVAFLLLGWSAWRWRTDANPASSVEGFARVLEAIDPTRTESVEVRAGAGPIDESGESGDVAHDADRQG